MIRLDQICVCAKPKRQVISLARLVIPICRTCGGVYIKGLHR